MQRRVPNLSDPRRIVLGVLAALQGGRPTSSPEIADHLERRGIKTGDLGPRYSHDVVRASITALRGNGHAITTIRGWQCDAMPADYDLHADPVAAVFAANVGVIVGV